MEDTVPLGVLDTDGVLLTVLLGVLLGVALGVADTVADGVLLALCSAVSMVNRNLAMLAQSAAPVAVNADFRTWR